MNDNQLFALVRGILKDAMPARGLDGFEVARSFAPFAKAARADTVYLFKLFDRRHGSPQTTYTPSASGLGMDATESQQYETTFQASVLTTETTDPNALTPSDVLNIVADIMQSDETVSALTAQGVGIYRVGNVANPYNVDERAGPSFDFVLSYRRGFQTVAPAVAAFEDGIKRV